MTRSNFLLAVYVIAFIFGLSAVANAQNTLNVTYSGTQYWAKTIGATNLTTPNTAGYDLTTDYDSFTGDSYYINLSIVATGPWKIDAMMADAMPTGTKLWVQRIDSDADLTGGYASAYEVPGTYGQFFSCGIGAGLTSSKEVRVKVILKGVSLKANPGTYSSKTIEFSF